MSDHRSEYAQYRDTVKANPGLQIGRLAQALIAGNGDMMKSRAYVEKHFRGMPWMDDFIRHKASIAPGDPNDSQWAAPLVLPTPLANELVKILYPSDVLSQLLARGARVVPFNVLFPRVNVGLTAAWAAAGKPTPVSKQSLDTVSLGITKTSGLSVITEGLARSQFLDVQASIGQDLVQSLAKFRNAALLNPDSAGVPDESPASLTYGLNQIQSSGITIADIVADAGAAMAQLVAASIPLGNAVWVTSERFAAFLATRLTTTGAQAFPGMSAKGGSFLGLDMLTSGAETESNSPSECFLALMDLGSIAVALDNIPAIDVSKDASLQLVDNPADNLSPVSQTSLWQANLVAIRVTVAANWIRRRDAAFAIVRGINLA